MVSGFEVRVRVTYEYLFEGFFREVVAEVSHGVGPGHTYVLVHARIQLSVTVYFLGHIVYQGLPDLEAEA